nr:hypothetical protein [Deltaproteobacteria bacterium]
MNIKTIALGVLCFGAVACQAPTARLLPRSPAVRGALERCPQAGRLRVAELAVATSER